MVKANPTTQADSYRAMPGVSQSLLTQLSFHPRYAKYMLEGDVDKTYTFEDTPMIVGSLVDMLITQPALVERYFCVSTSRKPTSKKVHELASHIVTNGYLENSATAEEAVKKALEDGFSYRTAWDMEKRLEALKQANLMSFLDEILAAEGKFPVEQDTMLRCELIAQSLQMNPFTEKIFRVQKDVELHKQVELTWELNGVKCKGLVDLLVINRKEKTIQLYDLKITSEGVYAWPNKIYKYRYDLQAMFYTLGIQSPEFKSTYYTEDYTVLPFTFLVESYKYPGTPLMFELESHKLDVALHDGIVDGIFYKGIYALLDEYKFHIQTDQWDYFMSEYKNKGKIIV